MCNCSGNKSTLQTMNLVENSSKLKSYENSNVFFSISMPYRNLNFYEFELALIMSFYPTYYYLLIKKIAKNSLHSLWFFETKVSLFVLIILNLMFFATECMRFVVFSQKMKILVNCITENLKCIEIFQNIWW